MHFCGMTERFGEGAITYRLANQRPKFYVRACPPQYTKAKFTDACMEAFGRWSEVCDLVFTPTDDPNSAQFVIFTHQFDGPSGILADCMFPSPGLRQQDMRLDPSEKWDTQIDLRAVLAHEMGHGIGIAHLPSMPPPDLMQPVYDPAVTHPQEAESAIARKLYGRPQATPAPSPTPPIGDSLGLELVITQQNLVTVNYSRGTQKYKASGTAKPS